MFFLLLAAAFACPDDQVVGLQLKPWKAHLLTARPGSDEQHAGMAALRMKAVPEGPDGEADCLQKPRVEGVDIFDSKLTGLGDKLLQVRFRLCKGTPDEWQSLRLAVLVPLPEQQWCLLGGEELSADRAPQDLPCGEKLPLTVALKEMVEKGRNVVEAHDQSGSCASGAGMTNARLALYEAQGPALKKIFESQLAESNGTAGGQVLVQRTRLTLGKTFPKTIHLERCIQADCDTIGDFAYAKAEGKYLGR